MKKKEKYLYDVKCIVILLFMFKKILSLLLLMISVHANDNLMELEDLNRPPYGLLSVGGNFYIYIPETEPHDPTKPSQDRWSGYQPSFFDSYLPYDFVPNVMCNCSPLAPCDHILADTLDDEFQKTLEDVDSQLSAGEKRIEKHVFGSSISEEITGVKGRLSSIKNRIDGGEKLSDKDLENLELVGVQVNTLRNKNRKRTHILIQHQNKKTDDPLETFSSKTKEPEQENNKKVSTTSTNGKRERPNATTDEQERYEALEPKSQKRKIEYNSPFIPLYNFLCNKLGLEKMARMTLKKVKEWAEKNYKGEIPSDFYNFQRRFGFSYFSRRKIKS